jgi:NTE family protein
MPVRMAVDRGATKIIAVNMDALGVIRKDKAFENCDIRTIKSYWNLGSVLVFDPHSARHNLRLGYLDTMRSYGVFDGYAFAFVKGTLSAAVREYYADFYRTVGLLGFENKNNKILSTVAYQKIRGRVFRRGIRAPSVRVKYPSPG